MLLTETPNFKRGIEILQKYEPCPEIRESVFSDINEWYVGNMCIWEDLISEEEIIELKMLGFHWYEESECLLFTNSPKSIY
jgi:hypothetical protein